jgi:signal transduction histidine kinase
MEARMLDNLKFLTRASKEFVTKYPAVLSGFIIYSYLFFTIAHYLLSAKHAIPTAYEVFTTFDALPFMWLLSVALVKIINTRSKLHTSETEKMVVRMEADLKKTQLETLQEVARALQHHINNPLAIISLSLSPARRQAKENPELSQHLDAIEEAANRIARALEDFSRSESYQTEHVDSVGSITSLPKQSSR